MKRKVSIIVAAIALLVVSVYHTASAANKPYKDFNSKEVIWNYVNASLLGSDLYTNYMFADDFEYRNTANNDKHLKNVLFKIFKINKKHTIRMRANGRNCRSSIEYSNRKSNHEISIFYKS